MAANRIRVDDDLYYKKEGVWWKKDAENEVHINNTFLKSVIKEFQPFLEWDSEASLAIYGDDLWGNASAYVVSNRPATVDEVKEIEKAVKVKNATQ